MTLVKNASSDKPVMYISSYSLALLSGWFVVVLVCGVFNNQPKTQTKKNPQNQKSRVEVLSSKREHFSLFSFCHLRIRLRSFQGVYGKGSFKIHF